MRLLLLLLAGTVWAADPEALLRSAEALRDQPEQALVPAQEAARTFTDVSRQAAALRVVGEIQGDIGDKEAALASLQEALKLAPGDLQTLRALVVNGAPDAKALGRRAAKAALAVPDWCRGAALRYAAQVQTDAGDYPGAKAGLARVLKMDPYDVTALQDLVRVERLAPDVSPAPEDAAAATAPDPLEKLRLRFKSGKSRTLAEEFTARIDRAPGWQRYDAAIVAAGMWHALGEDVRARDILQSLYNNRENQSRAFYRMHEEVHGEAVRDVGELTLVQGAYGLRVQLGQIAEAEAALERALGEFAFAPDVLETMIEFQLGQGERERAAGYARRLLETYEKAPLEVLLDWVPNEALTTPEEKAAKAELLRERGRRKALRLLVRAGESSYMKALLESPGQDRGEKAQAHVLAAEKLRGRDDAGAQAELEKALGLIPGDRQALLALVEVQAARGKADAALKTAERLAAAQPDTDTLWRLSVALSSYPKTAQELIAAHPPKDPGSRAEWLVLRGDYAGAVASDGEKACYAGVFYIDRGGMEPAYFDACLKRFPEDAALYLDRGVARYRAGRQAKSIEDFRKAIALRPDYAEAFLSLATALLGQGSRKEALEALDRAVDTVQRRDRPAYAKLVALRKSLQPL